MVLSGAAVDHQERGLDEEHEDEGDLETDVLHAGPGRLEIGLPSRLPYHIAGDVDHLETLVGPEMLRYPLCTVTERLGLVDQVIEGKLRRHQLEAFDGRRGDIEGPGLGISEKDCVRSAER